MTDWSREEEEQFRALVRQAEAQSWDYYQRGGGQPEPEQPPQPEPVYQLVPPPEPPPQPNPPSPPPQTSYWVNPNCLPLPPAPPPPPQKKTPAQRPGIGSALRLPFELDSETLLLAALLWLLVEEEADWRLILALAYILIV